MTLVCGIEEAGRGPVIGPLVMCGILIDEKDTNSLLEIGVKDSKLLTPKQRKNLFSKITGIAKDYKLIIVPPKEIDDALLSDELNLNWLEARKSADIINQFNPDRVILDCPSNNRQAYKSYLQKLVKNSKIEIIAEHKADLKFAVVSAASILAKVTRDNEIEILSRRIGQDMGSGYPADPVTKEFLKKNYDRYPSIFRKTWAPYKEIVKQKDQRKIPDF